VWHDEIPELWECDLTDYKYLAFVVASYTLVMKHIVLLIEKFSTWTENIGKGLRGVYPQSSGGGKFAPTLTALEIARLTACLSNLESGLLCDPVLAECLSSLRELLVLFVAERRFLQRGKSE